MEISISLLRLAFEEIHQLFCRDILDGNISYPSGTIVKTNLFNRFPYLSENSTPFIHSMIFHSQLSLSLSICAILYNILLRGFYLKLPLHSLVPDAPIS